MGGTVTFAYFFSCLELTVFYVFDLYFVQALNRYKREYPELDDCAPQSLPDVDGNEITRAAFVAAQGAANVLNTRNDTQLCSGDNPNSRDAENPQNYVKMGEGRSGSSADSVPSLFSSKAAFFARPLHAFVVIASMVGPICAFLMTLFPHFTLWMSQDRAGWLRDIAVMIGLAIDILFIARIRYVQNFAEVSKSMWVSLMWFRLDFMLLMAINAIVGFGAILVGMCMLVVDLYLIYRLMKVEKALESEQLETQLLRDDAMTQVNDVLVPGSVESRKIAGVDSGYTALQ